LATASPSHFPLDSIAIVQYKLYVRYNLYNLIGGERMQKILYVEDNDDNVYVMKGRLPRLGFEVVVAADGEQGVAMAETEAPDLILMDLRLPGIDGWETTRRIKAAPATKAIPVIALSAHAMAGDREKALEAGCDDYDTKPVDFPRLLERIRTVLARVGKP
jgi:two-component system cell cycle response regulator DivK